MKKHYITFVLAMLPFALLAQTINTVKDTLGVAFYADYTAVASTSGNTLTVNLTENLGALADILGVEVYRNFKYNRLKDRVRFAVGQDISSGTLVIKDEFATYDRNESDNVTGYDGVGTFPVGEPVSYSISVIMNDSENTKYASSRTIQSIYIPNLTSPDANVVDDVNVDMKLWTRAYNNLDEEYAIVAIGLQPSTTYPNNPYELYQAAIIARTGGGIDWSGQPCYGDLYVSAANSLDGRLKLLDSPTAFGGSEGVIYHRIDKSDVPDTQIDAEGKTYVSIKFSRPNSTQPANGFTYGSTITVPIQITSATAGVNDDVLSNFAVYPNPSTGFVNFKGDKMIKSVEVYNLIGKRIMTKTNINKTNTSLDISNNTAGIYFAKIQTEAGTTTRKLILE